MQLEILPSNRINNISTKQITNYIISSETMTKAIMDFIYDLAINHYKCILNLVKTSTDL